MPKSFEKKIRARGGAVRFRTVRLNRKEYLRVAIVRKKGKQGGKTLAYVKKYKLRR